MSNKRTHIESKNELSIASKAIENGISMAHNFKLSEADRKPIECKVGHRFLKEGSKNNLPF